MRKIPFHTSPYCLHKSESAHKAYYYLSRFVNHKIVIVVDDDESAIGILTPGDFTVIDSIIRPRFTYNGTGLKDHKFLDDKSLDCFCNRDFKFIRSTDDRYTTSRNIFADAGIQILDIPILDENSVPVGIIARWQAFYKEHLDRLNLERVWYAEIIMDAALLAKKAGYESISVLEFGVSSGSGLTLAELYAIETERLTGVKIELYGFDNGTGLPEIEGVDKINIWKEGDFSIDDDLSSLQFLRAKMIYGDIRSTAKKFMRDYKKATIGAILVDVDLYSSTVPILNMLKEDDSHFLPIVYMWFDDIYFTAEYSGEWLAVREFNAENQNSKIVPESATSGRVNAENLIISDEHWWSKHMKRNIRFSHPKMEMQREIRHTHGKII